MSEMQRNKGIIKELYPDLETIEEKIIQLHEDTQIPFDDLVYIYQDEPEWTYIDHEDYDVLYINDETRLFDVSGAPDEYDSDEEIAEAVRLNDTDYRINLHWYNGGDSPIDKAIAQADAVYSKDSGWKDTTGVKIRMVLSKYDDESVKYTFESTLDSLLSEDDAGCYGYESAQLEAADRVDGDNSKWEDWQVETVEYKVA